MALDYTDKVLDYFRKPRNAGELKNADVELTEGSPACGDMITYYLKINGKTHVIEDIKFKSYGCASNIATASILTEVVKGKTVEELEKLDLNKAANELGGLPAVKMHCSVLAVKTLQNALKKWKKKKGLLVEDEKLTDYYVKGRLMQVINPEIGINILRLKMVKKIEINAKKGLVKVEVKLGNTDERYAPNIEEEIIEHLKGLPGVKEVKVKIRK